MNEDTQGGKNILLNKSFLFAVLVVNTYKVLANEKEYVLSKQLLRSGTAIGALAREAQNAESKLDFIHKLGIAQKECDETIYWIELLEETNYLTEIESSNLKQKANELLRILRAIILSIKKSIHNS